MDRVKRHWKRLPTGLRRVLTLIIGVLLIIIAGLIGPIPGPGGTIIFLLGIAVLATEFTWAERLRDKILTQIERGFRFIKRRPLLTGFIILVGVLVGVTSSYILYRTVL